MVLQYRIAEHSWNWELVLVLLDSVRASLAALSESALQCSSIDIDEFRRKMRQLIFRISFIFKGK